MRAPGQQVNHDGSETTLRIASVDNGIEPVGCRSVNALVPP
jgi:hypothetical protein